ncbi:MAG: hypothetical protein EOO70_09735, partial [Myxococcaceae bacterium]
ILDAREPAQWPAGARPVDQSHAFDGLGRLLSRTLSYRGVGAPNDVQVSPFLAEEAAGSTRPIPQSSGAQRKRFENFVHDGQGRLSENGDDTGTEWDRSLGTPTFDPYKPHRMTGTVSGTLSVKYDQIGNTTDLIVRRPGTCMGGKCVQHFIYDWDARSRLQRARRWDYAVLPTAEPTWPEEPTSVPAIDANYVYSELGRVIKSVSVNGGSLKHTLEPSAMLRYEDVQFRAMTNDYVLDPRRGSVSLPGVARVVYSEEALPTMDASGRHVLLLLTDAQRTVSTVIDRDTSEVVEVVSTDPYGKTESDYRPPRWGGLREPTRLSGKTEDIELGLQYFGARYYSPYLRRWMSPDPVTVQL